MTNILKENHKKICDKQIERIWFKFLIRIYCIQSAINLIKTQF
jgi:hypothetical protein